LSASTWVYVIRHGEVEQAVEGRFFGQTDVGLSAVGGRQVETLARVLGHEAIEAVYSSDLTRARASAAPLAAARGVAPVAVPALREMALGRWEGWTFAEMQAREPELVRHWLADPVGFRYPGGEGLLDLRMRALPALAAVVAGHPGGRVAVVAHGGTNRVILGEVLGVPLGEILRIGQDYAAWSLVEYGPDGPVLHALNQRIEVTATAPVETTVATAALSEDSPR
jgi:broad specificity phosphatase PhoE